MRFPYYNALHRGLICSGYRNTSSAFSFPFPILYKYYTASVREIQINIFTPLTLYFFRFTFSILYKYYTGLPKKKQANIFDVKIYLLFDFQNIIISNFDVIVKN